jgi:hypothetical protein
MSDSQAASGREVARIATGLPLWTVRSCTGDAEGKNAQVAKTGRPKVPMPRIGAALYGYDRPRRRPGAGQGSGERLITTAFISEGLKDIWARSREDFDCALLG